MPWMVLGLTPAFLAARLAAMALISLPMWDWLMEIWMARLMMLPVPQ